jgi:hypothetical protein
MIKFLVHLLTDYDNKTYDTGRSLVVIVILCMSFAQIWDVIANGATFNATNFGTGVAAILVGLAAYIFGDNTKRPPTSSDK